MKDEKMYKIADSSPESIEDLKINEISLKDSVDAKEYSTLLDEDNLIDIHELLDRYDLEYIENETWLKVSDNEKIKCEIDALKILNTFYCSPDQYEGIASCIISRYLVLFASCAEEQGGGFAIIDIESEEWIFETNQFTIQQIIWIPHHKVFVSIGDVSTYAWHTISLHLITLAGKMHPFQLFGISYFQGDKVDTSKFLEQIPRKNIEADEDDVRDSEYEPELIYNPANETISYRYFTYCDSEKEEPVRGNWIYDFQKLIDSINCA